MTLGPSAAPPFLDGLESLGCLPDCLIISFNCMVINCKCNTKESLKSIVDSIPLNKDVVVTLSCLGSSTEMPVGKLHNAKFHGEWAASLFWENGKYCQYIWVVPTFNTEFSQYINSIKVL